MHQNVYILIRHVKLNTNISVPIERNNFFAAYKSLWRHAHYHKQVHFEARASVSSIFLVIGMTFSYALEKQAWVVWWRVWYFWIQHDLRTWHVCVILRMCRSIPKFIIFLLHFRYENFNFFRKWISIK